MKYKQGDVVFLKDMLDPIVIMYEHSGNYDYQYTGSNPEGDIYYFNEEDVTHEGK